MKDHGHSGRQLAGQTQSNAKSRKAEKKVPPVFCEFACVRDYQLEDGLQGIEDVRIGTCICRNHSTVSFVITLLVGIQRRDDRKQCAGGPYGPRSEMKPIDEAARNRRALSGGRGRAGEEEENEGGAG